MNLQHTSRTSVTQEETETKAAAILLALKMGSERPFLGVCQRADIGTSTILCTLANITGILRSHSNITSREIGLIVIEAHLTHALASMCEVDPDWMTDTMNEIYDKDNLEELFSKALLVERGKALSPKAKSLLDALLDKK